MTDRQPEPAAGWTHDARATAVLDHGRKLYLAVASRWGPHVTPQVFDRKGKRLWLVIPRQSLRARVISDNPSVGGLVSYRDRAVVFVGRAHVVDPLGLRLSSPSRLVDLPLAIGGYVDRNKGHAAGMVRDRPVPTLPLSRVAVVVDVASLALLEGFALLAAWGQWAERDLLLRGDPLPSPPPILHALPTDVRELLMATSDRAVLGWQSLSGPLVLPAHGDVAGGRVETSRAAMVLAGAPPRSPSCLTVDRGHHRLDSKRGVLVRGEGRARIVDGTLDVVVQARRVSYWFGDSTGTVTALPTA